MFAVMKLAGYQRPKQTICAKRFPKSMKEKLQKHREKFIDGAVDNGILERLRQDIFDDWEEFARYGFNKAMLPITG